MVFLVVGLFFVGFAFMAVAGRGFRTGVHGTTSGYISATEHPVQFWTVVVVMALLGVIALYCVFTKGKGDAPNGGPATPLGNSGVTEEPPSVS